MRMTFYTVMYRWCKSAGTLLMLVGLLNAAVAVDGLAQGGGGNGDATLWAQLLNAAVVLLVGAALAGMFFKFKDQSIQQANDDRIDFTKELQGVKSEINELTYMLRGIDGQGGLFMASAADTKQRHFINNRVMVMQGTLIELLELLTVICNKLGIPFDRKLIADLEKGPDV